MYRGGSKNCATGMKLPFASLYALTNAHILKDSTAWSIAASCKVNNILSLADLSNMVFIHTSRSIVYRSKRNSIA